MWQGRDTTMLSLRARLLQGVPRQVQDIKGLTVLDLECNLIDDLAEAGIGSLERLHTLKLSYNQILSIPAEFAGLTSLTILEAKYNFLPAVPRCICGLPLQRLELDSNQLMEMDDSAARLTGLRHLSLTNNTIRKIGTAVFESLTRLETLLLKRNEMLLLPDSIMCLERLSTLDVSFNQLYALPHGFGSATCLSILRLAYNDLELSSMTFDSLSNLEELILTSNRLAGIPHTFAALKKLTVLHIGGNMFSVEPQHQFLKTWETTQRWLRSNLESYVHAQVLSALSQPSFSFPLSSNPSPHSLPPACARVRALFGRIKRRPPCVCWIELRGRAFHHAQQKRHMFSGRLSE